MTAEERKKELETGLDKMEAQIKEIREDIKNGRADNLVDKARYVKSLAFCLVHQATEYEAKRWSR
ncbi:hypothetical protein [Cloacibacillus evryensis]|uniref:hypothetical protein n=1 Tax=Cloacibacillus evryensis TaxID=508460 RepID=UPI0004B0DEBB|nr:hypothetical protein [Cloacibacillus evryensis]